MRKLIFSNANDCVGCNRCARNCPVEIANITTMDENGNIKVDIDADKCIACGACIGVCKHGARTYIDDTEKFIDDLKNGAEISLIIAPALRSNIDNTGRLFTWLKKLGVHKIYDVSLGADICTWAHIRYIQKNKAKAVITQPCPVIVNYCVMYRPKLLKNLSPVHSPMLCTAVYMKEYEKINTHIAAISPCIAKSHEFESTNLVQYNVTLKKLLEYIEKHNIKLSEDESDFDHYPSGLGSIYSMPGGLKENVEFFLGKDLRIDKSEGQSTIYHALDSFAEQSPKNLPDIFDVLNCPEGCNAGTGCIHNKNIFEINTVMDIARKSASKNRNKSYFKKLYNNYDKMFQLEHFIRRYTPSPVHIPAITEADIDNAFSQLGKDTEIQRNFDCGACGSATCFDMARKIALHTNIPENCIQKNRENIKMEHAALIDIQNTNLKNIAQISTDINNIKTYADTITSNINAVTVSLSEYENIIKIINTILKKINIISLNASIEAVRAGEYGKSFAVIAAEIQNLANISKDTISKNSELSSKVDISVGEMTDIMTRILSAVQTAHINIQQIINSQ